MRSRRLAVGFAAVITFGLGTQLVTQAQIPTPTPLAKYPGFDHNPEADELRYEQEELAREALIAKCMAGYGFPYVVSAPSILIDGPVTRDEFREFAENDPNTIYEESLSPEARQRYYVALYGIPDPNDESAVHEGSFGGGCVGGAHRSLPGVYATRIALRDEFENLLETIRSDPRVAAAELRWADCMTSRGYQGAPPSQFWASLEDSLLQPGISAEEGNTKVEQAEADGQICRSEAQLDAALTEARMEHEAAFVQAHLNELEDSLTPTLPSDELAGALCRKIFGQDSPTCDPYGP